MKKCFLISILTLLMSNYSYSQEIITENQDDFYVENDTVKKKKREVLNEVIVVANPQTNTVEVGKSKIKPLDLPQASAVIQKETLDQQQVLRISDVLKNTNGVYVSGASSASGNNQEEYGSRGFTFSGNNTFKNGIRFNGSLIPETSSLESVEILKGSTALLFGNVGPGGILNLVTKKPKFNTGGEINFRASEYNFYKPTIDVYGAINNSESVAFRVITSYEKGNSFRNTVESERIYFNPSVLFNLSKKTTILVEADYLKDSRTPDFGLTTIDYKVIELPRNSFLGFNWGKFDSNQQSLTTTISHQLSSKWQLKGIYSYQGYETNLLSTLRPNATNLVQANGDWTRGVQKIDAKQDYSIAEIDLTGNFKTGTVSHNFLLGIDADRSLTNTVAYKNITFYDKINIYNPTQVIEKNTIYEAAIVPDMDINTNADAEVKRVGIYFQDMLELTSKFKILAGMRYSYLENTTNDNVVSTRLGLVYQPTTNNSIFASYSDSFVLNTGTDRNFNALPTSTINQYEIGFKNEFFNNKITLNITGYLIDYSNLAQTDFSNGNLITNIKELAGAYKSEGIEVDLSGKYKNFNLLAGYSFNETKYTKSNIYNKGTALRFTPKHTANASVFYTFNQYKKLRGLELGLQSNYVGNIFGGRLRPNNASTPAELARKPIPVNGFLQFDASIGYSLKSFTIRAKLSNFTNALSYYVYDDNTVTPIAPRMISSTITYKF